MDILDLPQDLIWDSAPMSAQALAWDTSHEETLIFEDSFVNGKSCSRFSLECDRKKSDT